MFNQVSFLTGASSLNQLPKTQYQEIAFIGRSNVGKSSLINAVVDHSSIAKVSKTPGRTQQINFFQLSQFIIVDLPGYGYASAPLEIVAKWQRFNMEYMKSRKQLLVVFILIDGRIGIKEIDLDLITQLNEYGVKCKIIYTKIDKLNKSQLGILASVTQFNDLYSYLDKSALMVSSHNKEGIAKLRKIMLSYLNAQS